MVKQLVCKGSDITGIKIEQSGEGNIYQLSILNQPKIGSLLKLTVYSQEIYQAVLAVITGNRSSLFTFTFTVSGIRDCIGIYYAEAGSEFDMGVYVEPATIPEEDMIRFRVAPRDYQPEYDLRLTSMPLEDELNLNEGVYTLEEVKLLTGDSRGQSGDYQPNFTAEFTEAYEDDA